MKTKSFRLIGLAALLALFIGCESNTDYGEIANLHDSYTYRHPSGGFYDPWYGSGAYVGSGYYGGASVGIGISVPLH